MEPQAIMYSLRLSLKVTVPVLATVTSGYSKSYPLFAKHWQVTRVLLTASAPCHGHLNVSRVCNTKHLISFENFEDGPWIQLL